MPVMKARPVAKKKQSGSESRRYNTLVRMDDEIAEKARKVASLRKQSLGEYLASIIGPIVERDLVKEGKKLTGGDG
jgi:hypothetical protein